MLLAEWAERHDEPVLWLTVDERHRDGQLLAADLLAAAGLGMDRRTELAGLRSDDEVGLGERFCEAFAAAMGKDVAPVLVVQNVEQLPDHLVDDLVSIAEALSAGCSVVLASRSRLGGNVRRLRAADDVAELRPPDLRFDLDQSTELLRRVAGEVPAEHAGLVHERTEGWPVAMTLAGVAWRDHHDRDSFVASFARDGAIPGVDLAEYLTAEVLAGLPDDLADCVRRLSVLDTIHIDAVPIVLAASLGVDPSTVRRDLLEHLAHRTGVLDAVDADRRIFRLHALVRAVLRRVEEQERPEESRRALVAAAAFHRQRGEVDEAGPYLLRSEDWAEMCELLLEHGARLLDIGRLALIRSWLRAVPDHEVLATPQRMLVFAELAVALGESDVAEQWVRRRRGMAPPEPWYDHFLDLIVAVSVLYHRSPNDALAAADRLLDRHDLEALSATVPPSMLPHSPGWLRATAGLARARAAFYLGDLDRAERYASSTETSGYLFWDLHRACFSTLLAAERGRFTEAERLVSAAQFQARAMGAEQHPALVEAWIGMADVALGRGAFDEAAEYLDRADRGLRINARWVYVRWVAVLRAELALLSGEPQQALALLEDLSIQVLPPAGPALADRTSAISLLASGSGRGSDGVQVLRGHGPAATFAVGVLAARRGDAAVVGDVVARLATVDHPRLRRAGEMLRAYLLGLPGRLTDHEAAVDALAAVLDPTAEAEGDIGALVAIGPPMLPLLRTITARGGSTGQLARRASGLLAARQAPSRSANGSQLSRTELRVLALLSGPFTLTELARHLYVSPNTVKTHVRKIYRKLGVENRRQAVVMGHRLGLLDADRPPEESLLEVAGQGLAPDRRR